MKSRERATWKRAGQTKPGLCDELTVLLNSSLVTAWSGSNGVN